MRFHVLALPLLSFILLACSSKPSTEAESVIRQYDAALIKAFAAGDNAALKGLVGEKEFKKVGTLIDYKRTGGLALQSEMLGLSMDSCDKTADDAITATTTERWRYFDRPLKPGAAPGKTVQSEMKLRYFLQKESGSWKVIRVEGISNRVLNEQK